MKITIIYDTQSGHTEKMAQAVAEGARSAEGVDIYIKHVDEATSEDLFSEGVIIGSPAYCGLMTWKLKALFDRNMPTVWGKVNGHIGAAFSSSGGLGGGNEMTVMSILNSLLNYGYMVFGLPEYAGKGVTAHYGAVAVGDPGELELKACRMLGKRTAEYVKRMHGSSCESENTI
ncbi:MAG: flavodoxin domain-containing protein [Bacillota bacterium]|nr:flavodoxin domain-containing protein [Bacillota bacterium]